MDLGLQRKVAVVTGSYRGTGAGIAETLAEEGATVFVHGFEAGQPDPIVDRLRAAGGDARPIVGDILDDTGADAMAQQILDEVGGVDILVNNYGVAERGRWFDASTDDWVSIYHKNVLSGVRLVRAFAPGMSERGWGRIIWLGTVGSLRPNSRMPHYYASKGALPTVCVSLAKELSGTGVTVNLVSPGLIATAEVKEQMARNQARDESAGGETGNEKGSSRAWAGGLLDNPIGRMADIEEVASLVAYLAGERSGAINGANLRVDGGAADCATA
jgi:NAD(P)-dependent dehydrogenase (short-subunit alcohol dehydrogenase family)